MVVELHHIVPSHYQTKIKIKIKNEQKVIKFSEDKR